MLWTKERGGGEGGGRERRTRMLVGAAAADAQARDVALAEGGLLAAGGVDIRPAAALGRRRHLVEVVRDLVLLKGGAQARRDRARDTEALVTLGENVQEREGLVFADGGRSRRIDEVPAT